MSAPVRRAGAPASSRLTQTISVWGLLVLLVLLIVFFSILKPDTFPTYFNMRSIINNKAISALLALAVFLPMTANHFDLSAGFLLGIAQVLVIGLQGQGLGGVEASALVLILGALVGLFNGVLVTVVGIDSFIATLGTGTLLYGFNDGTPAASRSSLRCRTASPICRASWPASRSRRSMCWCSV